MDNIQQRLSEPSIMSPSEIREELTNKYHIYDTAGLSHFQLARKLRELRAGQQPVMPLPLHLMEPAIMSSSEIREELTNKYHIYDTDRLSQYQLARKLRELRAGQQPVMPLPLHLMEPAIMSSSEIREELTNKYHIYDTDGLTQKQLARMLRDLRAGRLPEEDADDAVAASDSIFVPPPQPGLILMPPSAMTTDELREEIKDNYNINAPGFTQNQLARLLIGLREGRQPSQLSLALGGRKRLSKQRRLNRRRSNRK